MGEIVPGAEKADEHPDLMLVALECEAGMGISEGDDVLLGRRHSIDAFKVGRVEQAHKCCIHVALGG